MCIDYVSLSRQGPVCEIKCSQIEKSRISVQTCSSSNSSGNIVSKQIEKKCCLGLEAERYLGRLILRLLLRRRCIESSALMDFSPKLLMLILLLFLLLLVALNVELGICWCDVFRSTQNIHLPNNLFLK